MHLCKSVHNRDNCLSIVACFYWHFPPNSIKSIVAISMEVLMIVVLMDSLFVGLFWSVLLSRLLSFQSFLLTSFPFPSKAYCVGWSCSSPCRLTQQFGESCILRRRRGISPILTCRAAVGLVLNAPVQRLSAWSWIPSNFWRDVFAADPCTTLLNSKIDRIKL